MFVGGSIDIGIIFNTLRAHFAHSWATRLMSLRPRLHDAIWHSGKAHQTFGDFVRNLAHVAYVRLHWRDRQPALPSPAAASRRTGLQAALARAEAALKSEHTMTFVTRAEPHAFVSGATALSLLSLSRGAVDNFARILRVLPRLVTTELFAQSAGAHVFDHRTIGPVLQVLRHSLDISDELFFSHKVFVGRIIVNFLTQHLRNTAAGQPFVQRVWPIDGKAHAPFGGLGARALPVIDALVASAESQLNVYNTRENYDGRRLSMQQHGLIFAAMFDGLEAQLGRMSQADGSVEELRYRVRQRIGVILRRAQEGFFVPGEPRLRTEQLARLPDKLRQARQQLG